MKRKKEQQQQQRRPHRKKEYVEHREGERLHERMHNKGKRYMCSAREYHRHYRFNINRRIRAQISFSLLHFDAAFIIRCVFFCFVCFFFFLSMVSSC